MHKRSRNLFLTRAADWVCGEDTAAWYNRKYTNLMAKKMYPLVRSYIVNGRSIDRPFTDQHIQLYHYPYRSTSQYDSGL